MPDGTEFVLDNEKDTESQFARVTNQKEGQRSAKDSVSNKRLAQKPPVVKNNISDKGEDYSRLRGRQETAFCLNELSFYIQKSQTVINAIWAAIAHPVKTI